MEVQKLTLLNRLAVVRLQSGKPREREREEDTVYTQEVPSTNVSVRNHTPSL